MAKSMATAHTKDTAGTQDTKKTTAVSQPSDLAGDYALHLIADLHE
jgi:hypothetical protein